MFSIILEVIGILFSSLSFSKMSSKENGVKDKK